MSLNEERLVLSLILEELLHMITAHLYTIVDLCFNLIRLDEILEGRNFVDSDSFLCLREFPEWDSLEEGLAIVQ